MDNRDVARILRETANLLQIDGASIGRYRSYEKTAEMIESHPESIAEVAKDTEKLMELPGIGDRMAEHIQEILKTGDYSLRQKLLKKYPPTILDLLKLQSLGPKRVALLWSAFHAATVEDVERLCREEKLRAMPGFGEKSEQNILRAIESYKRATGRFQIHTVEAEAAKLIAHINALGKGVESVTPAGSLRRGRETIGDLDLLLILAKGHTGQKQIDAICDHIALYPEIDQVIARGENKLSFRLKNHLQVDVRLLEKDSFGAAMIYFTGSKEHNVVLRGRANKMGWTLNEYAMTTLKGGRRVAGKTEEEIYAKLGMAVPDPEIRENSGEIDAALENRLPKLVRLEDIRGDLQMHTTASDGRNSIEEMGAAAKKLGYEYIAITDHSKAVTVANGLDERRTLEHIRQIREAQKRTAGIRLLAGMEVDILKDGSLDLDAEVLAQLDVVVCSIHSYINLDRAAMTQRLLAGIENPYTQIIAHPTGRQLLRREGYMYDMERVLDAAAKNGVAMECNAYPDRLDLCDVHLRMAKDRGAKVVISTDAHSTTHLPFMRYGVITARRGWLTKKDVINTLPVEEFLAALRPRPAATRAHAPARGAGSASSRAAR
ncbi:MAG: DNA polymerase/3'-5' exonuclease PolX [Verrucomicrobiales bacterium]|nr:DNA polymerase/3'-5' exonuclease PolX [Verrucomicrobiales bacterium]